MKIQFHTLSSSGEVDVEPKDTIQSLKIKLCPLTGFPEGEIRLTVGCTTLPDDSTVEECQIEAGSQISVLRTKAWERSRMDALKNLFLKQGELHSQASEGELSHDSKLPAGLELPDSLTALLQIAPKWNFTKGSCDVFNCNIYLLSPENCDIFGDEECREEWKSSHDKDFEGGSCAGKDWACIGATSEYDFYFVNLCKESPLFGATRRIVNNCDEEDEFTEPPFEKFLNVVEAYAKTNSAKEPEKDGDYDDIEFEPFEDFTPCKKARTA
eukprot:TRINITY_DN38509_c0_g1_i1.p1 TRINITY_DN38509_c0_g1~~TRINITY_DN38509_c0_g1_i1.p1  ORF type:complete len:285 (+),score=62.81 TRINITY_DN38509_c0_g1_i1:49-855(+)